MGLFWNKQNGCATGQRFPMIHKYLCGFWSAAGSHGIWLWQVTVTVDCTRPEDRFFWYLWKHCTRLHTILSHSLESSSIFQLVQRNSWVETPMSQTPRLRFQTCHWSRAQGIHMFLCANQRCRETKHGAKDLRVDSTKLPPAASASPLPLRFLFWRRLSPISGIDRIGLKLPLLFCPERLGQLAISARSTAHQHEKQKKQHDRFNFF